MKDRFCFNSEILKILSLIEKIKVEKDSKIKVEEMFSEEVLANKNGKK